MRLLAKHPGPDGAHRTANTHPSAPALGKEHRLISNCLAPNAFNLALAAATEKVEANAVGFGANELMQAIAELRIFCGLQIALKYAVLHPLPIGRKDGVDFGAAFVFGNVVGDDNVHGEEGMGNGAREALYLRMSGGYCSVSPIKYLASRRA